MTPSAARARRVVVALGGNAMTGPDGRATEADQIAALRRAAVPLADLVAAGVALTVVHGNGPQVGNLLVKNELSAHVVPPVPLDWCVASTQATIGFVLANALQDELAGRGLAAPVVPLVTRTLVDPADPAFSEPVKPVGRFVPGDEAQRYRALGQHWIDLGERGWRRVVASPWPQQVLESPTAAALLDTGAVVICAGGGGIPVARGADGRLSGVEAVVDKDLAAGLLAAELGADLLVIATDVAHAVLRHGTPQARPIGEIDPAALFAHHAAGEFGAGSMGPKVLAAATFADAPGRTAVITALELLPDVVAGRTDVGTRVVRAAHPVPVPPAAAPDAEKPVPAAPSEGDMS